MKVVTSKQMAAIESQAYKSGLSEADFMEEAGKGVAEWVHFFVEKENFPRFVYLLCGKGNNAGDAYVAGCYLIEQGYTVIAYQLAPIEDCSPLCQANHERYVSRGGQVSNELDFSEEGIILDAIFGTGFEGEAREPYASAIAKANASENPTLSIDIPSGLNGDTGKVEGEAILAKETIFLGLPKTGFFLEDGWNHVGKIKYVDFGLPQKPIEKSESDFNLIYPPVVKPSLPKIINNRHKYQAGFVVALAGSPGMPGAALLATTAALKGGAGIVKLLHPDSMTQELSSSPYELIKVPYSNPDDPNILELMNSASAVLIGPGLGKTEQTKKLLQNVLPKLEKPCVIDADALTILAEETITLPPETILTPHIGEMKRLLNDPEIVPGTPAFLDACKTYAQKHKATIILKGGPTFVIHPKETIQVNPYGDPGMATAGSGDVLTGLLAALLAQGVPPKEAASLGVYLHGFAGEDAAELKTSYCLIASDIIEHFPSAFWSLK